MSTLVTAARNAACDAVVDLLDAGSGAGKLIIRDSGNAVLATLTLSDPAFGAATAGVATASAIAQQNASGTGTAANFIATDSADTQVLSGSVKTSGGDLNLVNLSIATGQPVLVSSWTHTQEAGSHL